MDNIEQRIEINLSTLLSFTQFSKAINLSHPHSRSLQKGHYLSQHRGQGMEFQEVRPYQLGDDIRNIDWKVTARTHKPHTKIFQEERERPVFISVDDRKTMQFATQGVFKSVQAKKMAALIAWAAYHHSDKIGGQIFTEELCQEIKPQGGNQGVLNFLNMLVNHSRINNEIFSFKRVISRLQHHTKPGSTIYLISDFRGVSDITEPYIAKLARHSRLILIFIYDPIEKSLPKDHDYCFTNGEREILFHGKKKKSYLAYQDRFHKHQQTLENLSKKIGFLLIIGSTQDDPLKCLR